MAKMGLSSNRFCLNGLAGGNRGGPCTRRFQHTSTLSLGVWLRVGVARVVRAQSASQVSDPSSEKSCKFLRHMWKAILGAGDNVRLICSHSDMMRNTYDVVYDVVYDIVCDITYDIVCDIVYDIV